jgi:hypothetical protein
MEIDEIEVSSGIAKLKKYIKFQHKIFQEVVWNLFTSDYLLTIRELARKFRIRQSDVLDMIEDSPDLGYNVGVRINNGIAEYKNIGDYTVDNQNDLFSLECDEVPSGPNMVYEIWKAVGKEITIEEATEKWNNLSDSGKDRMPRVYSLYVVDGF